MLLYANVHRHLSADSTEKHLSKTVRASHTENATKPRNKHFKKTHRTNTKHSDYCRAYPLFDEVMKYKQFTNRTAGLTVFVPTAVVSEWVYLSAFVVPASLHPDPPSSPLGCGKLLNLRLAIGYPEARDITGHSDWRRSSLPAPPRKRLW